MLPAINNVVNTGEYRKRITIQQNNGVISTDPNDLGQLTTANAPVIRAWAKISNTKGREYQLGLQVVGESSDIVEMRYQPGITPKMQVVYTDNVINKTRTLDINNVTDPDERHVKLYLFCTEATTVATA